MTVDVFSHTSEVFFSICAFDVVSLQSLLRYAVTTDATVDRPSQLLQPYARRKFRSPAACKLVFHLSFHSRDILTHLHRLKT